ncbi:MAG TPA: LysM peptidoglycan-binding domain-containing protein [Woeseiaceae bacterium]|nr:LysM peptidoglycan-binding domain-containing protein [Woeseiaceae bacterium]
MRYVISRGDTLSEIAQRYNVSLSVLRSTNNLSGDTLRVGQTLNIPVPAGS